MKPILEAPGVGMGEYPGGGPIALRVAWGNGPRLSSSLLGKGFDGHEAQPVAGGLVAVDDPTECKLAYFGVVSHPAGETVAHLIDKFLQRRSAQRLWFVWLRPRLHSGHVVAKLPCSVPPHPFRGSHRLGVLRVTSLAHIRNVAHSWRPSRSSATRTPLLCFPFQNVVSGSGSRASRTRRWIVPWPSASASQASGPAPAETCCRPSSGPAINAWELSRVWPDARLRIFGGSGHKGNDAMAEELIRALDAFARL